MRGEPDIVTSATVVICTRHRPDDLARALQSVAWQDRTPEAVLVIDDSDPDRRGETKDAAVGAYPGVEVVTKDQPGLTASRNLAIERCTTNLICFLDDDVVLRPGYLRAVVDTFEHHADVVGVAGVVDDDHEYELPWLRAIVGLTGTRTGKVYRSGWSSQLPHHDADVEHLIGCNMTFRMSVLQRYRFDTGAFAGYGLGEDLELTHRLHLDGHRLRVAGDARLWHLTAVPRHDRTWGRKEIAIRPVVARHRFSKVRFLGAAGVLLAHNAITGDRERAKGNLEAIRTALAGSAPGDDSMQKPG